MNNNKLVGAVITSMVEKFQVIEIKALNVEEGRLATSDYKITILLGQGQQVSVTISYHARIKELAVKDNKITAMTINALSFIESIIEGF